jgi:adenine-specific DNA methylase
MRDRVQELTTAIHNAMAASLPKHRTSADLRSTIFHNIQDKIRLNNRLRKHWQVTRDPTLKAQVNRLQRSINYRLNEWKNEKRERDPISDSFTLCNFRDDQLSDSEKAEALTDSL